MALHYHQAAKHRKIHCSIGFASQLMLMLCCLEKAWSFHVKPLKPTSPKIHKALRIWGETTCRPASPTANPPFIDDNFKIFLGHHQQSSYHQFSTYQFTMSFTQLWLLDRHGKQNPFFQIWQWFCCQVLLPEAGRPGDDMRLHLQCETTILMVNLW